MNAVMVLGMCFFAGGLRFAEQGFDASETSPNVQDLADHPILHCLAATQVHSSLLSISVGAVLMPAAYHFSLGWSSTDQESAILKMSHGVGTFSKRENTQNLTSS
jgi:Ca2+:H+ antiporter